MCALKRRVTWKLSSSSIWVSVCPLCRILKCCASCNSRAKLRWQERHRNSCKKANHDWDLLSPKTSFKTESWRDKFFVLLEPNVTWLLGGEEQRCHCLAIGKARSFFWNHPQPTFPPTLGKGLSSVKYFTILCLMAWAWIFSNARRSFNDSII